MRARRIGLFLLIIIIGVALAGMASYFFNAERNNKVSPVEPVNSYTTNIRSEVMKDLITYTIKMTGITDALTNENYYETISISFDNASQKETFVCDYTAGNEIKKDEKLYSAKGKDYYIDFDGRVMDVSVNDTEAVITVVDYSKVYIKCQAEYKNIDLFKIGETVNLQVNYGDTVGEEFQGKIAGIGSVVEDNKVDIYIKADKKLLPGVSVNCEYYYEKDVQAMFVLKKMILSDGMEYYVQRINEDGDVTKIAVELGEEFHAENGEVTNEYVEVFGNLAEGDKLTVDVFME